MVMVLNLKYLPGTKLPCLVDAVQAVVGEGQLTACSAYCGGGKVHGIQAVVAPCVDDLMRIAVT